MKFEFSAVRKNSNQKRGCHGCLRFPRVHKLCQIIGCLPAFECIGRVKFFDWYSNIITNSPWLWCLILRWKRNTLPYVYFFFAVPSLFPKFGRRRCWPKLAPVEWRRCKPNSMNCKIVVSASFLGNSLSAEYWQAQFVLTNILSPRLRRLDCSVSSPMRFPK